MLYRTLLAAGLALLALTAASCSSSGGLSPEYSYGEADLYRTEGGAYRIAVLRGSWSEMGRQYGGLLGPVLREFHDEITADLTARGADRADLTAGARENADVYSSELLDLLAGMAETSGLTYDEVLVLNSGMMFLAQAALSGEPPAACSGIGVWNDYTADGRLVFGRNWDISREAMLPYMKYLGIVVLHPDDGYALANIHPLGAVYLETGLNSRGLLVELNNGEQSDDEWIRDREDTASYLVEVLNQAADVDEAADMLKERPADVSYIIQLADPKRAVSVERPTFGCRVREGDGLIVAYNSFAPPYPDDWQGRINPPPPVDQDPRYENLVDQANSARYKGRLDAELMMELIGTPVEEGGAEHAGTVIQVAAVPEDLTVWIRGTGYTDFEKADLSGLLTR
jgi:hypothetical protein